MLKRWLLKKDVQVSVHAHEKYQKRVRTLCLCHQLRDEGLPIFYGQNNFTIHVYDFDVTAAKNWLKRANKFRGDNFEKQVTMTESSCIYKRPQEMAQSDEGPKEWTEWQVKAMEWQKKV